MKGTVWVILVVALATGSSCTHPDWIERTLVTVDVTGTWSGTIAAGANAAEILIDLKQEGPKVEGSVRWKGFAFTTNFGDLAGLVEGTVSGDRFEFRRTNGHLRGDVIVSGDEMTGHAHVRSGPASIVLRRVK
jgi:hypothetical protein